MPDISGILDMGRRALATHQRSIAVTSHNISNVDTPGYSRQETVYAASRPREGVFGTGVELHQVRRTVDQFLEMQVLAEQSTFGRLGVERGLLTRAEAAFNDSGDAGISRAMADFFSAVGDLVNHPSGESERVVLLERGRHLAQRFRDTDEQIRTVIDDANAAIEQEVIEINALAKRIADLTHDIRNVENTGNGAHDLRDDRTRLMNELSDKVGVEVLESETGLTVTVGSGGKTYPLILNDRAYPLSVIQNPDRPGQSLVVADKSLANQSVDITESVSNGKLKGLIQLRDHVLPGFIDRLDKLSASFVNEFNLQHRAGFNLDGETNEDFFAPLTPTVWPDSANTGDAVITVSVAPLPEPPDPPEQLQLDKYDLSFSGEIYTLRNRATGAEIKTTDTEILFEGMVITINESMAEGDHVEIGFHLYAAKNMAVALSDPDHIAAASSEETLPGDNTNAIRLAALQHQAVFSLREETFDDFYAGLTAEIGTAVQEVDRNLSVQEGVQEKLASLREEVSGVSLDEEMTRLIQFQRAYQASARLVTTADELLETVIGLKR
jgi:flagellar hook-associated protein 1 FlgK